MGTVLALIAIDAEDKIYVSTSQLVSVEAVGKDSCRVYATGARGWTLAEPIQDVLARIARYTGP